MNGNQMPSGTTLYETLSDSDKDYLKSIKDKYKGAVNNTVTVSQPVTLFRVNEYNWKLSDSFNSTTMRFLFNIKDEIASAWAKIENQFASLKIIIEAKVERDIRTVTAAQDFVTRKIKRETSDLVSGTSNVPSDLMSFSKRMGELSSRSDSLSLIMSGINPAQKSKLLGDFSASTTKQRVARRNKNKPSKPLAADSLYRSVRMLPNKLKYDYDRRVVRNKLKDDSNTMINRQLPSSSNEKVKKSRVTEEITLRMLPNNVRNLEAKGNYLDVAASNFVNSDRFYDDTDLEDDWVIISDEFKDETFVNNNDNKSMKSKSVSVFDNDMSKADKKMLGIGMLMKMNDLGVFSDLSYRLETVAQLTEETYTAILANSALLNNKKYHKKEFQNKLLAAIEKIGVGIQNSNYMANSLKKDDTNSKIRIKKDDISTLLIGLAGCNTLVLLANELKSLIELDAGGEISEATDVNSKSKAAVMDVVNELNGFLVQIDLLINENSILSNIYDRLESILDCFSSENMVQKVQTVQITDKESFPSSKGKFSSLVDVINVVDTISVDKSATEVIDSAVDIESEIISVFVQTKFDDSTSTNMEDSAFWSPAVLLKTEPKAFVTKKELASTASAKQIEYGTELDSSDTAKSPPVKETVFNYSEDDSKSATATADGGEVYTYDTQYENDEDFIVADFSVVEQYLSDLENRNGYVASEVKDNYVETVAESSETTVSKVVKFIITSADVALFLFETLFRAAGPVLQDGGKQVLSRASDIFYLSDINSWRSLNVKNELKSKARWKVYSQFRYVNG